MNANYILGLFQGDGSFNITIHKRDGKQLWLSPKFNISLHAKHVNVIKDIQNYFNVGHYRIDNQNICRYEVNRIEDIYNIIIPFFLEHRLKGEKYKSFIMFKIIVTKLYNREHYIDLNNQSHKYKDNLRFSSILLEMINMVYIMNPINHNINSRFELLNFFNKYESEIICSDLIYEDQLNQELINYPNDSDIDIQYIQGLFDADGSISVYLDYNRLGNLRFRMTFNIVQDKFNKEVIDLVQQYFNCGQIYKVQNTFKYDIKSTNDIKNKVLPKLDINWIKKHNNVRLYKFIYLLKIFEWLDKNKTATIKTIEDFRSLLSNIYYIRNNPNNETLEEYINYNITNTKLKK